MQQSIQSLLSILRSEPARTEPVETSAQARADSAPTELDAELLDQVGGGVGSKPGSPNGTW
jgi:hypothetical protein